MYKLFYEYIPAIFNDSFVANYEIHDDDNYQKDNIHVDVVETKRRGMTMP